MGIGADEPEDASGAKDHDSSKDSHRATSASMVCGADPNDEDVDRGALGLVSAGVGEDSCADAPGAAEGAEVSEGDGAEAGIHPSDLEDGAQ